MNNTTLLNTISQEPKFTTIAQLKANINDLPKLAKQTLYLMINLSNKHDLIFPSRETMAATLGTHVKAISVATNQLHELGIISKSRRYNKSNYYFIHPHLSTDAGKKLLKKIRTYSTFALSFLFISASCLNASSRVIPLNKGLYIKAKSYVRVVPSNSFEALLLNHQQAQYRRPSEEWDELCGRTCDPKEMTIPKDDKPFLEMMAAWEAIADPNEALPKKEFSMDMFTEEQLLDLVQFSKPILQEAQKTLTKEIHSGKKISNHFAYFKAVCVALVEKSQKRDGSKTRASVASRPVEEWQPDVRPVEDSKVGYLNVLQCQAINPTTNSYLLQMIPAFRNRVVVEYGEQAAIDIENSLKSGA